MNLFNIFILSFGALQGVLLSVLLLQKKIHRTAYFFLLLYLLVLLLQTVLKIADKIWLLQNVPVLYGLSYHLPFLYGPLLYFFVRNMVSASASESAAQKTGTGASLWHFLPFLYFISIGEVAKATHNELAVKLFYFFAGKIFFCQLLSLLIYHLSCYTLLRRQEAPGNGMQKENRRWLERHTLASSIVTVSIAAGLYLIHLYYPRYAEARFLFAAVTFYVYWLSYEAMRQPELFYQTREAAYVREQGNGRAVGPNGLHSPLKYASSTLTKTETESILVSLSRVMQQQRPYLNPDLNIDALAALAGTNRHHLSQVINGRLQKNFYEYLNEYRVSAAMQLLADPAVGHLKIAAIAYDAGFHSLSTFNDAFKKMTGHTPTEFRKRGDFRSVAVPAVSDR